MAFLPIWRAVSLVLPAPRDHCMQAETVARAWYLVNNPGHG